jgi:hypothetical protein
LKADAQLLGVQPARLVGHNHAIKSPFEAIRELRKGPEKPRPEMGFHVKQDKVAYRMN